MISTFQQATLALTCYNRDKFESVCRQVFPKHQFHSRETDTERFGWLDDGRGTALVWMVGTHGETRMDWLIAWFGNLLASDNDNNGQHDGFQMLADMIDKLVGEYLLKYHTLYFFGHSRACAVLAILAYMLKIRAYRMRQPLGISGRVFCPPIPGNADFARAFNAVIPDWIYYRSKGDLINTKLIRNAKSDMLDGVDVGIPRDLPQVSVLQSVPVVQAVAHSPKWVICDALRKAGHITGDECERLKGWCVN